MSETWENPTIELTRLRTEHAEMSAMLERIDALRGDTDPSNMDDMATFAEVAADECLNFRTMKAKRQQEEGTNRGK